MNYFAILLLFASMGQQLSTQAPKTQSLTKSPGAQLYYKALALEREGDPHGALDLLHNLLIRFPKDTFCDDAMAEVARLQEELLAQPAKALDTWKILLNTYPHSRLARRGRARVEFLQKHLDAGQDVLAEYERLLRQGASLNVDDTLGRMNALLDAHPDFSLKAQGLLFVAQLLEKSERFDQERQVLEEIVKSFPEEREAGLALVKLGRLAMKQGRLDEAGSAFERLKTLPGSEWTYASEDYLARLGRLKTGHWTLWLSMSIWVFVMFAMILSLVLLAARHGWPSDVFWPPPVEALVFLLVMTALIAVVWAHANQAAHALLWMTVLMTPVLLGNGYLLRRIRMNLWTRVLWLAGGSMLCVLSVYASISLAGMLGQVLHTMRFGFD